MLNIRYLRFKESVDFDLIFRRIEKKLKVRVEFFFKDLLPSFKEKKKEEKKLRMF